ncbi:MAG TPA: helix-turn-helix domain-containing protein [Acidimicrobiales bacterium]|nr:helix-turn-helix domain-containing protein [Acidimicrobiales bacterium]
MIRQTWLTVKEAGEVSGMGERFIRRMVNERRIRFYRVGRFIRIEERDLLALMEANMVEPVRRKR